MVTLRISYKDRVYEESLELPKNFSDRFDPLGMHGILIGTASALLHKICSEIWQRQCGLKGTLGEK